MGRQITRLKNHYKVDGLKKSFGFYKKMTATYSKQFIKATVWGIAKGWGGAQSSGNLFNELTRYYGLDG